MALTVEIEPKKLASEVVAPPPPITEPYTSQSPAVKDMLVILAPVDVVRLIAEPEAIEEAITSPILPAVALSLVAVPRYCPCPKLVLVVPVSVPVPANPKPLIVVAVAAPNTGVTKVGVVANTALPVPVLVVKAASKLALDGVAKKVATPAAKPDTPVLIGKPVQLVRVPEEGVPKTGVVKVGVFKVGVAKVGLVANTFTPVPVLSVSAEDKLALEGVVKKVATLVPNPLIPVETGSPVTLVITPEAGVPKAGVINTGEVIVCTADQLLGWATFKVAVAAPETVETVILPSTFVIEFRLPPQIVSKLVLLFFCRDCPVVPPIGILVTVPPPTKELKSCRRKGEDELVGAGKFNICFEFISNSEFI